MKDFKLIESIFLPNGIEKVSYENIDKMKSINHMINIHPDSLETIYPYKAYYIENIDGYEDSILMEVFNIYLICDNIKDPLPHETIKINIGENFTIRSHEKNNSVKNQLLNLPYPIHMVNKICFEWNSIYADTVSMEFDIEFFNI